MLKVCTVCRVAIILSLVALFSSRVSAQSATVPGTKVKNSFIVSVKKLPDTKVLAENFAKIGVAKFSIKPLFPQFCSASKKKGNSPEVAHLQLMQASIESLPDLDTERSVSLRNYLKLPGNKNFCIQYVLAVSGVGVKNFESKLRGKKLAKKLSLSSVRPIYRYQVKKAEVQTLVKELPNPGALVAIISSRATNGSFLGLRSASPHEVENRMDDDQNGYVDDRFGINSNESESGNTNQHQGYVTLAVAKDKGEQIEYSTVEAAQGVLYALHRGAAQVVIPFSTNDSVVGDLASSFKTSGGSVITDLSTASASTSGLIIKGNIQFDYDPNALGYKDDHFKMLVLNSASSSSGGTEGVPLSIGAGVKTELRKISAAFYEYKITNAPSSRFMMALAGEYFLCGDGVSFNPVVDMGDATGEVPGRNFNCYWAPGMTASTRVAINETTDKNPVRGVYIAVDNLTPGVPYEESFQYFYTRLNGDTELKFPVGSFIRYTVYDNWQLMGEPEYGGRVAFSEKKYVWTAATKAIAFGTRDLGIGLCFKATEGGKPVRYAEVKGDFYKGSQGYFDFADTGSDGYNCFSNILQQATWSLTASHYPYTGSAKGTLASSSIHIDFPLSLQPTPVPTPRTSPTKVPTRTPTKVPGSTPTPNKTSEGTPQATASPKKTEGTVPTRTPISTIASTVVPQPSVTVVRTAMATLTPLATKMPIGVTVEAVLTRDGTILSGYKVKLIVDGVERSSQTTSISGAVKFSNVPLGEIAVEPPRIEGCRWLYSLPMPFEELSDGSRILQSANLACETKTTPTATPKNTVIVAPTATRTATRAATFTATPEATSTISTTKVATASPTRTPTRTFTPTRTVTPTRTSLSDPGTTPFPTSTPIKTQEASPTPTRTAVRTATATATATKTARTTSTATPSYTMPSGRMTPHTESVRGRILKGLNKPAAGVDLIAYMPRKADAFNSGGTMVFQTVTDSNGNYSFDGLYVSQEGYIFTVVPGLTLDYPISTRNPKYSPTEIVVDLSTSPLDNVVADIWELGSGGEQATPTATPRTSQITVEAYVSDSARKPIVGHGVQLIVSGKNIAKLYTDSMGKVRFDGAPGGEVSLEPNAIAGCGWTAGYPMPMDVANGRTFTQAFLFDCVGTQTEERGH